MKKTLLSLALVASFFGYSQDNVYFEDCSGLTVGNVGVSTSATGAAPGQGGYYTIVSTTANPAGANTDFQVVDAGGVNGNCFQITGTSGSVFSGNSRQLFRGFNADWINRTGGNDVVQLEYDFYTGPVTTAQNSFRNYIFNDANNTALAGFYFDYETMEISGWAYYDNTASGGTVGYYVFGLGDTTTPEVILDPDTWYRIGVAYDYNTGDITWKEASGLFYGGVTGAAAGSDIDRVNFQLSSIDGNAGGAAAARVDNINLSFHALEELLGVKNSEEMKFLRVSPNPAKDILTISNQDTTFNSIEVTDLNGRVVAATKPNAVETTQVNIADLSAGVYMVKIVSDKGTVTKKIIKE